MKDSIVKGIILAGGSGTRLYPVTARLEITDVKKAYLERDRVLLGFMGYRHGTGRR